MGSAAITERAPHVGTPPAGRGAAGRAARRVSRAGRVVGGGAAGVRRGDPGGPGADSGAAATGLRPCGWRRRCISRRQTGAAVRLDRDGVRASRCDADARHDPGGRARHAPAPLTDRVPKCMIPLAGRPLLEHTVVWLRGYGVTDLVINVHHLAEVVERHFGDGARFGVRITSPARRSCSGPRARSGSARADSNGRSSSGTATISAPAESTGCGRATARGPGRPQRSRCSIATIRRRAASSGLPPTAGSRAFSRSPRRPRCSATGSVPASWCSTPAWSRESRMAGFGTRPRRVPGSARPRRAALRLRDVRRRGALVDRPPRGSRAP